MHRTDGLVGGPTRLPSNAELDARSGPRKAVAEVGDPLELSPGQGVERNLAFFLYVRGWRPELGRRCFPHSPSQAVATHRELSKASRPRSFNERDRARPTTKSIPPGRTRRASCVRPTRWSTWCSMATARTRHRTTRRETSRSGGRRRRTRCHHRQGASHLDARDIGVEPHNLGHFRRSVSPFRPRHNRRRAPAVLRQECHR